MYEKSPHLPVVLAIGGHDPGGGAGIQADMAGTALRGSIVKLLNPAKGVSKTMEELGLNMNVVKTKALLSKYFNGS